MIPYFEVLRVPLWGSVTFSAFGALVVTGVLVGAGFAFHRAHALGIPSTEISGAIAWAVGVGFLVGHAVEVLVYHPEVLREWGVRALFEFWNGLSSFGGFAGALLGVAIHFRRLGKPWLVHAEILIQALVIGWVFGRLGCTLVHDHVGVASEFVLAIRFPDGPRHDLGLYELLYTLFVLVPAVVLLVRKDRVPGTTVAVLALLYAPARFMADFLRSADLPGSDPRYLGLTPAQYGCIALLMVGLHFARRTRARSTAD